MAALAAYAKDLVIDDDTARESSPALRPGEPCVTVDAPRGIPEPGHQDAQCLGGAPDNASEEMDDAVLMSEVAQGSTEALLALHERFGPSLRRFGLRHLNDERRADAFVVEVMTRLWRTADRFDADRGALAGWVFTIARRLAIDGHRRERTRRQVPLAGHDAELIHVDRLDDWLRAELVRTAMRRLSTQHQQMIELAYYEQLSQQEIASRTGLPLGTVKSRTYYALRSLRLLCDELGIR